jgi:uncharacterized membrane protein YGL010W
VTKTELFTEYASYHTDRRNRACHAVGIPLIVLGVLGLFSLIKLDPIDLAIPVAVLVLIYYATLTVRGALISLAAFAILYVVAVRLPWQADVAAFVLGWIFQLIGHRYEGNKPKFLENLTYLLIGPLYFFDHIVDRTTRPRAKPA